MFEIKADYMIDPALRDCRQRTLCLADELWESDAVWDSEGEWGGERTDFIV